MIFPDDYNRQTNVVYLIRNFSKFASAIAFLFLDEYWLSSKRGIKWRLVKWFYFSLVCTGVLCILVARGHYLVDIVLGYWCSTRVFFIYHCACDNALRRDPSLRYKKIWWHTLFTYVESDIIKHQIKVRNVFDVSELLVCFRTRKS